MPSISISMRRTYVASTLPPAAASAAAPRMKSRRFRGTSGRPVLDVALQHLVLEVLLFENRLRHVAKRDHAEQLAVLHHRQVARAGVEHGAAQVVDLHLRGR